MKIHMMKQQTPEWLAVKLGKMGSTTLGTLLVKGKSESGLGAGAITNLYKLVGEILTGASEDSFEGNKATERGNNLEPIARKYYEDKNWVEVKEVGFVELNDYIGCSPDGLIAEDGLIEIKCLNAQQFVKARVQGISVKPEHYKQTMAQMFVTGRKWCDYVLYHPGFKNPMIVHRIERDEKIIQEFESKSKLFIEELEKAVEKMAL